MEDNCFTMLGWFLPYTYNFNNIMFLSGAADSLRQVHLQSNTGCDFKQLCYLIITRRFFFYTIFFFFYTNGGHIHCSISRFNYLTIYLRVFHIIIMFVCMYQNAFNQSISNIFVFITNICE